MFCRRKRTHIHSDFRDDTDSGKDAFNGGERLNQIELLLIGRSKRKNERFQFRFSGFKIFDMSLDNRDLAGLLRIDKTIDGKFKFRKLCFHGTVYKRTDIKGSILRIFEDLI